jgi:hypothetical protein
MEHNKSALVIPSPRGQGTRVLASTYSPKARTLPLFTCDQEKVRLAFNFGVSRATQLSRVRAPLDPNQRTGK